MKYPSNPKTNLKDEYESLKKQRDEEMEWEKRMAEKREKGREDYRNQLKLLSVARGGGGGDGGSDSVDNTKSNQGRKGWFGWLRGWRRGNDINDEKSSSVG